MSARLRPLAPLAGSVLVERLAGLTVRVARERSMRVPDLDQAFHRMVDVLAP